jgi:hypothetical protein
MKPQLDLDRVAEIALVVCKAEAPKFRSEPEEALGRVWQKVVENEKKLLVPFEQSRRVDLENRLARGPPSFPGASVQLHRL